MTETQSVKVYELAKELGVDSLSLIDKLKGLNLNVKSHMSELTAMEAETARNALKKPSETKTAAKKTAGASRTIKKKTSAETAPSTTTGTAATSAGPATPAAKTPKTTTRSATSSAASAEAEKKAAPAQSSILRRRTKSDDSESTTVVTKTRREIPPESSAEISEIDATLSAPSTESATETEAMESQPASFETTEEAASPAETAETAAVSSAPAETASESAPAPVVSRRNILTIVQPKTPTAPKIIKPAPPAGTSTGTAAKAPIRGTSTQDKDGFRIIRMTKENLDQMVEEEASKKRGVGTREVNVRPEDVKFADYRKKELVFLPKKKKLPLGKMTKKTQITTPKAQKRIVEMKETITVQELAAQLNVKAGEIVKKLMMMGQMASMNQALDFDTATLVAGEYQYEVRNVAFNEEAVLDTTATDAAESLISRPPVVTIMGHVDHGKTTLLDSIRSANVAAGEAGGITQHIGAYTVEHDGKLITFIDTPGHEAFSVMRARGATVTDIVILVVSADDGVMPQTREALSHAQAAGVPIIVAVNKIDKPGANPEKIKQGLAELNLLAEDWGGETMFVPVSALKKTNIDKLLEAILLQSEVLDLKANPDALASGTVLEARLEKGRGPMVSVLVDRGTLRVGDAIVSGQFPGRVKAMMDDKGAMIKECTPGMATSVLGFEGVPNAGENFNACKTEADAREVAQNRVDQLRAKQTATQPKMSLDALFSKIQTGDTKELNVVLKGDVFGSVEAIKESIIKLSTEKVKVKVLLSAPGGITESDVMLAAASSAVIIGFNVRPETKARQLAEAEHVDIKTYSIIYELIDDIKAAMTGLLEKRKVERFLGRAEVRQIFSVPKFGVIAGSAVIDGKIVRGANIRLLRESRIIYEGKMSSLRRFKDDAKEVAQGFECGIGIENYNDLKMGDIIEAYQIDMVAPTLMDA